MTLPNIKVNSMTTCSRCILNSNYPGLGFNEKGECSFCTKYQDFKPIGEDQLLKECANARNLAGKRNIEFDVLAKYVANMLSPEPTKKESKTSLTEEKLRSYGYVK